MSVTLERLLHVTTVGNEVMVVKNQSPVFGNMGKVIRVRNKPDGCISVHVIAEDTGRYEFAVSDLIPLME